MKIVSSRVGTGVILGFLFFNQQLFAQANSWTSPASGNWEDSSWSLGVLPGSGQDIMITNAGWKAVAITINTIANFPQTLSVNSVTVTSPQDTFNTLLLDYSGIQTPLSAGSLTVGSNSAVVVDDAAMRITNSLNVEGNFVESGYSVVTAQLLNLGDVNPATFNLTNSSFSTIGEWPEYIGGGSVFNQHGGTNVGDIQLDYVAEYDLYDGGNVSGAIEFRGGNFNQWDGNVSSISFYFDAGTYQLAGGTLSCGDLQIPTDSNGSGGFTFLQTGGTASTGNINLNAGAYNLSGGTLNASNLNLNAFLGINGEVIHGDFNQTGGTNLDTGINIYGEYDHAFSLVPANYNMSGGWLVTPSISLDMGAFTQSGGINTVNNLAVTNFSTYDFIDGFLSADSMNVSSSTFRHEGSTNHITQIFIDHSTYSLSGGRLNATQMSINGVASFFHYGGIVSISDFLSLTNTYWHEESIGGKLGKLAIAGTVNVIYMPTTNNNSCILAFDNSASMNWDASTVLRIENWNGSLYGGGTQQILFTNYLAPPDPSPPLAQTNTLTAQQISQIRFLNPAGLPAGTYSARQLWSGEIVPDSGAPLPLALGRITFTNRLPQIQLMGDVHSSYTIQASTNLINWDNILTFTNYTGIVPFIDGEATNYPHRFYRAQLMP